MGPDWKQKVYWKHSFDIGNMIHRLETYFSYHDFSIANNFFRNYALCFQAHFTVSKPRFLFRISTKGFQCMFPKYI